MAGTVKDISLILSFQDDGSVKVRRVSSVVKKELAKLGKEAEKSGQGFDKLRNRVQASNKGMSKFKGMMKSTWAQMAAGMGIMMGIQGAIRLISRQISNTIKVGREFERAWVNTTTMMDISAEKVHKMRTELLYLNPILGDTTDLAKGMYQVLSASIAPSKAIMFITEAAKSAQAGVTDTTTAVDALTTILNAYGMEAERVGRISDIMFATVKRGKLTYEGMAGALGTVAPIAAQLGIRFEEIAAAMATLTRQGVDVNTTTVQLRQVMVSVLKPTTQAYERAKKLGISFDSTTLKAMGLAKFIEYVTKAVKDDSDALTDLFGNVRALTGIMGLGGKRAADYAYDLKFVGDKVKYTEQAFKKQMASSDFWIRSFQNVMNKARIAFWQGMTNPLKEGIKGSKDFQDKFAGFARNIIDKAIKVGQAIAGGLQWLRSMKKEIITVIKISATLWLTKKIYLWIAAMKTATATLGGFNSMMGRTAIAVGAAWVMWKGLIYVRDKWIRGEGSIHNELKGTRKLFNDLSVGLGYWGGAMSKSIDEMKAQNISFQERSKLLDKMKEAWDKYGQNTTKTLEMILKGEHGEKLRDILLKIGGAQAKMAAESVGASTAATDLTKTLDDLTKQLTDTLNKGIDPFKEAVNETPDDINKISAALKTWRQEADQLALDSMPQYLGMTKEGGDALMKLLTATRAVTDSTGFWIGANEKLERSMWPIMTTNEKVLLATRELMKEAEKASKPSAWLPSPEEIAERMRLIADALENGTESLTSPWENLFDKIKKYATDFSRQWDAMFNQLYQNQIARINNEYQERKNAIDASLKSDEEKYFAIETLDREMEKRRIAAMRKQAAASKLTSIAMATINVAEAVTAALKAGPIIGPILAGIIGAMGAIQIAAIVATPLPSYATGGIAGEHGEEIIRVGEKGPERITPLRDERRQQRIESEKSESKDQQRVFRFYLTTYVGGRKFEDEVVKVVNTRGDDIVVRNTSVI